MSLEPPDYDSSRPQERTLQHVSSLELAQYDVVLCFLIDGLDCGRLAVDWIEWLAANENLLESFLPQQRYQSGSQEDDSLEDRVGVEIVLDGVDGAVQIIQYIDKLPNELVLGLLEIQLLAFFDAMAGLVGLCFQTTVGIDYFGELSIFVRRLLLKPLNQ